MHNPKVIDFGHWFSQNSFGVNGQMDGSINGMQS